MSWHFSRLLALVLLALAAAVAAQGEPRPLPPLPEGVAALELGELFTLPIGRRGLELTPALRALDGRRVRVLGYPVQHDEPVPGRLLLTSSPVRLHDREYGLADDLPAATLFVFLADEPARVAAPGRAPLLLTGTLDVGPRLEADGRTSLVRLHVSKPTKPGASR